MNKLVMPLPQIEQLAAEYEQAKPEVILRKAFETLPNITFACSFGAEDMVLMDMIMNVQPDAQMFYLDTDLLFSETYALREEAIRRYGFMYLTQVRPALSLAEQSEQYGHELWAKQPDVCCILRKVNSLSDHLHKFQAWITGIRREQAVTRANAQVFEWDQKFEMVKVNPLATWTNDQVWNYIRTHHVPYNPLHDNGYPSIGCIHCTRPVKDGEDPRSGRWSGHEKTECGLHH